MSPASTSQSDAIDFSVAIPAYGQADSLAKTLECVLAQRWPSDMKWEVLVNDDGTQPPLEVELEKFKDRVRFERNSSQQGWPENWNRTLEKARGRWVHVLHHDDLVDPDFAPTMWKLIQAHPQAAFIYSRLRANVVGRPLVGRIYVWIRKGMASWFRRSEEQDDERIEPTLYKGGVEAARHVLALGVPITTIVVRREVALSMQGMRKELLSPSDEEYVVRLAQQGDVVDLPRQLCTYVYHARQCSLSAWLQPSFVAEYRRVHEESLKALGAEATEADRKAAYKRVANGACTVAGARALAGHFQDAATALDDAARLMPEICHTADYRRTKLIVTHRSLRFVYRWLFG